MALYVASETLHDTAENRTHPARNILRDRHLKVGEMIVCCSKVILLF